MLTFTSDSCFPSARRQSLWLHKVSLQRPSDTCCSDAQDVLVPTLVTGRDRTKLAGRSQLSFVSVNTYIYYNFSKQKERPSVNLSIPTIIYGDVLMYKIHTMNQLTLSIDLEIKLQQNDIPYVVNDLVEKYLTKLFIFFPKIRPAFLSSTYDVKDYFVCLYTICFFGTKIEAIANKFTFV